MILKIHQFKLSLREYRNVCKNDFCNIKSYLKSNLIFSFILSEISREFQTRYQCYHGIREIQRAGKTAGTKQISGNVHHLLMIVFYLLMSVHQLLIKL